MSELKGGGGGGVLFMCNRATGSGKMPQITPPQVSARSTSGLLARDMLFDHYFLHPSNNLQFIIGRKL